VLFLVEKKFQYTVPSEEGPDVWVQETPIIYPDDDPRDAAYLDWTLPPTGTMMLHYLPYSLEVLFRTPH
jgi:hypothetical protein